MKIWIMPNMKILYFCNEQKGEESKIKINNGKNENCIIF